MSPMKTEVGIHLQQIIWWCSNNEVGILRSNLLGKWIPSSRLSCIGWGLYRVSDNKPTNHSITPLIHITHCSFIILITILIHLVLLTVELMV